MGDPTRSVAPDGIALGITGPRKPLHRDKVAIPQRHVNTVFQRCEVPEKVKKNIQKNTFLKVT